jgi:endoglucanase
LAGYRWYVDKTKGSWWVAIRDHRTHAAILRRYADNPMGKTFASFVKNPRQAVRQYLERAWSEQPGAVPFLNLSRIQWDVCPFHGTEAGSSEGEVESWVRGFSAAVGQFRVEIAVETDRLALMQCLPGWAKAEHYRELTYEVHYLHAHNPNAILYIDAGASDWGGNSPSIMASRLRNADIAEAQGFQLGASHHDWTTKEIKYGLKISQMLGGKHFIINTNANGWGGKSRWSSPHWHRGCIPNGEGVGIRPSVQTPDPHIDAFVWSGVPGYEGGSCIGESGGYRFYVTEAISLAKYANPGG